MLNRTPMPVSRDATLRRTFSNPNLVRVACAALLGIALASPQASAQTCAGGETPLALGFTGGEQTAIVPAGVNSLTVYLSGAQGGAGRSGAGTIGGSPTSPGGVGGLGGRVQGTLAVTPGATLSIWVGGQGSQAVNPGGIGQGANGIGGGATDLRVGGNAIGNRVAIAGGGGGGGNAGWSTSDVIAGGAGGVGGGGVGGAGATVPGGPGPFGGGGGAVGTGGAAGGGCGGFPATEGNAANGDGGDSFNFSGSFSGAGFGGGGGGGATVGAGGGGAGVGTTGCQQNWNGGGGGGAGGSSDATGLTGVTINNGVQAGNGAALLCYSVPEFSVGGTASGQTGPVTLQLAATNPVSSQQVVVAQAASSFVFPTELPQGANWNVSVIGTPPGQLCGVSPASGTAIAADVIDVALTCVTVAVTVDPAILPAGAFGAVYSQTLTATSANGGVGPYTFSVTAGGLPPGLGLSSGGLISGTPTAAGTFNFTVQAISNNGFNGSRAYALAIAQVDSDGDGVFDDTDTCPGTPLGATVDAVGCPADSDGDGVFDGIDTCAATPSGATVDAVGCPADSDGDGVLNGIDTCAATPAGAAVNATGCPADSDGDGVLNGIDLCPSTPPGTSVSTSGCPIATPTPSPTAAPTPTVVPTATPTPTTVPTPTPTATPTAVPTASPTPTPTPDSDVDNDGVMRSVESEVPNAEGEGKGDGNGDGVPDARQPFVASLESIDPSDYLTVVSVGERQLSTVAAVNVPEDFPEEAIAPFSGVGFTVLGLVPGAVETFEVYMPFDPEIDGLLKKNRMNGRWENVAVAVDAIGTRKTVVTFAIEDGGPYDVDGMANGVIVDPSLPAIMRSKSVSGSGGGAFGALIIGLLAGFAVLRKRLPGASSLCTVALVGVTMVTWAAPLLASDGISPWTVTFSSGGTFSDVNSNRDLQRILTPAGGDLEVSGFDRHAKQYSLRLGYDLTPNFGVEAGAEYLGKYDFSFTAFDPDQERLEQLIEDEYPGVGFGATLAAAAQVKLRDWTLKARGGYFVGLSNDVDYRIDGEDFSVEAKDNSWLLGVSAQCALDRFLSIGLDYQLFDLNANVQTLGIVLSYRL